jgi:hypothetical protein
LEAAFQWIERKRLQAPAAAMLEMHRPLAPLAWTLAMLAGPALAPFLGPDYYEKIKALRDPTMLDRLLRRLEASRRADSPNAETRGTGGTCGTGGTDGSDRSHESHRSHS